VNEQQDKDFFHSPSGDYVKKYNNFKFLSCMLLC
jgi:hypothetical protein